MSSPAAVRPISPLSHWNQPDDHFTTCFYPHSSPIVGLPTATQGPSNTSPFQAALSTMNAMGGVRKRRHDEAELWNSPGGGYDGATTSPGGSPFMTPSAKRPCMASPLQPSASMFTQSPGFRHESTPSTPTNRTSSSFFQSARTPAANIFGSPQPHKDVSAAGEQPAPFWDRKKRRNDDMDTSDDADNASPAYLSPKRRRFDGRAGFPGVYGLEGETAVEEEPIVDITDDLHHVISDAKTGALIPYSEAKHGSRRKEVFSQLGHGDGFTISNALRRSWVCDPAPSVGLRGDLPSSTYPDGRGQVILWRQKNGAGSSKLLNYSEAWEHKGEENREPIMLPVDRITELPDLEENWEDERDVEMEDA
ncbi:hypothetical protein HDU96_009488 [Phlyctochytrium bullatum]|nr:hypothetical protein HDU96_009488 [Phlyctochytrium bullatum]